MNIYSANNILSTYILGVVLFAGMHSCLKKSEKFSISPLYIFTKDYSLAEGDSSRSEYYLVTGFDNFELKESLIDSFVCANLLSGYENYDNYLIYFYRKSKKTNIKHLSEYPKDLDRYSNQHDLILTYQWWRGRLMTINRYFDGNKMELNPINSRDSIPCDKSRRNMEF